LYKKKVIAVSWSAAISPALNLQLHWPVDIYRVLYTNLSFFFYDKQLLRGCLLITSTCFPQAVIHITGTPNIVDL